jgi:hypothetical protein
VISAAWSSRRSAASFARKRAARARARGVVGSCWTGSDLHVGVGVELIRDPDVRSGLGVARTDADADINVDIVTVAADGAKDAKAMLDDIVDKLWRQTIMVIVMTNKWQVGVYY